MTDREQAWAYDLRILEWYIVDRASGAHARALCVEPSRRAYAIYWSPELARELLRSRRSLRREA